MEEIYEIHHLCINTPDMEKSIYFYKEIFGFTLLDREICDFGDYAMLRLGPSRLELISPKNPTEESFGDCGSITHFGLAVKGLDAAVAKLRAKGVTFLSSEIEESDAPMGGLRAIQLLGPAQEHINLYEFKKDF